MKIISKFKDFYDFTTINGQFDTDESIVFERIPKYFSTLYQEHPFGMKSIDESVNLYKRLLAFKETKLEIMKKKGEGLYGIIEFNIIGVFPKILILPMISIYDLSSIDGNKRYSFGGIIIDHNSIKPLEVFDERGLIFSKDSIELISDLYSMELNIKDSGCLLKSTKNHFYLIYSNPNNKGFKPLLQEDLIIECPEFFHKLKSPVFYMSNHTREIEYGSGNVNIVINCDFSEIVDFNFDFIKEDSINIRNRIEEFFIEQKIRNTIIPDLDNNIKITSHGFDLKTSFRKM